jgi:orotidine-5'-phosphate decarboxylase
MAIDFLQDKIRKLKNPSMIDLTLKPEHIPAHIVEEEGSLTASYVRFCRELMGALKDLVPAVRFSFTAYALLDDGIACLKRLLQEAKDFGYYVVLDCPEVLTPWNADLIAQTIASGDSYACDALVISPYIGSDAIKPFIPACKENGKDLFIIVRSPNKTASELQDLLTGTRHVYDAAAELVNRYATQYGKYGYSSVAAVVSAGSPDSLRTLRTKYNRLFLLVDGLDYPSGNAKNCSFAFDRFGYGAVVCAGPDVTCAWKEAGVDSSEYLTAATQAAERMKKNLSRYFSIL